MALGWLTKWFSKRTPLRALLYSASIKVSYCPQKKPAEKFSSFIQWYLLLIVTFTFHHYQRLSLFHDIGRQFYGFIFTDIFSLMVFPCRNKKNIASAQPNRLFSVNQILECPSNT